jgi:hypothetical protein
MSSTAVERPNPEEYAEAYHNYVSKVPGSDVIGFLEEQLKSVSALLRGIDDAKAGSAYQPGKWTIKELVGHLIDSERVFAYRALVFARNDTAALPGFDQDLWVQGASYANLPMAEIIDEFESLRRSTILQLRHFDAAAWDRRGTANDKKMTTRAAAYVIAGHTQHHVDILKSRYLTAL